MEEAIEYLAFNYDTPLSDPKLQEYLEVIEKEKGNPQILEIIKKQFRPTNIEVNTAGSYLWGCSQNYYGNVNKNCSPLCNNSIQYSDSDNFENNTCQYSIWTYDGELHNDLKINSTKAYIYVSQDWKGFKESDIEQLKEAGIYHATILSTLNSQHKIIFPMTSVDGLPIFKEQLFEIRSYTEEISSTKHNLWKFVAFLFLISLIIYYISKTYLK